MEGLSFDRDFKVELEDGKFVIKDGETNELYCVCESIGATMMGMKGLELGKRMQGIKQLGF